MNIYNFTGHLSKGCEQKFTHGGTAICSFTVAVDFGYGNKKGVNWVRCSVFGKRAESDLPKYLLKGTEVAVSGELKIAEYMDREGAKRMSLDVNVNTLDLLNSQQHMNAIQSSNSGSNNTEKSSVVIDPKEVPF